MRYDMHIRRVLLRPDALRKLQMSVRSFEQSNNANCYRKKNLKRVNFTVLVSMHALVSVVSCSKSEPVFSVRNNPSTFLFSFIYQKTSSSLFSISFSYTCIHIGFFRVLLLLLMDEDVIQER